MPESRKTVAGCNITRDFFMSTDGQDFDLMAKLMDKGFKELYYSAPYHWAVLHPTEKKIIAYTEGDVDHIDCEDTPSLIKEAEHHIIFEKEQFSGSPVVWKDGEFLVKELKKRLKNEISKEIFDKPFNKISIKDCQIVNTKYSDLLR